MPIYEMKCQSCSRVEEHLLKFSEPKPAHCEACGGPLVQLISQTSFALKGSGWYVTDYKKPAEAAAASESKPIAVPAVGTESKSDVSSSTAATAPVAATPAPAAVPASST